MMIKEEKAPEWRGFTRSCTDNIPLRDVIGISLEKCNGKPEKTCSECKNYQPDPVGCPLTGVGSCKLGKRAEYPLLWPGTNACIKFRGRGE